MTSGSYARGGDPYGEELDTRITDTERVYIQRTHCTQGGYIRCRDVHTQEENIHSEEVKTEMKYTRRVDTYIQMEEIGGVCTKWIWGEGLHTERG